MTEYDYSPEAKMRFYKKMDSIGKWTYDLTTVPQKDPFTPQTPAAMTAPIPRRASRRQASTSRAIPERSQTAPPMNMEPYQQTKYSDSPHRSHHDSKRSSSRHSKTHASSGHHRPRPPARSQTTIVQPTTDTYRSPTRSASMPYQYQQQQYTYQPQVNGAYIAMPNTAPMYVPNGAAYIPPSGRGGAYVMNTALDPNQYPQLPHAAYVPPQTPSLFRRMFGFLGNNSGNKGTKQYRSRRHDRRNSY